MTSTLPAGERGSGPAGVLPVERTVAGWQAVLDDARARGARVGVVPTMGALHAGHAALIERAAAECGCVSVTVFVNPTQFGDPADLAAYPRTLAHDLDVAGGAGAQVVFAPAVAELYPRGPGNQPTTVSVTGLTERWEGSSRPGHFDGVATVVTLLLSAAGPCRVYFGEKDFQQLAVVRRLVADLRLRAEVVGCPTVREEDGLARSSRNVHLGPEARRAALALPAALRAGSAAVRAGAGRDAVEAAMAEVLATEPSVVPDYAVVVDADELEPAEVWGPHDRLRLLVAATVGGVRLIDNVDPWVPA